MPTPVSATTMVSVPRLTFSGPAFQAMRIETPPLTVNLIALR